MKHFTLSEKDNPYMKRKELVIRLEHPEAPTPSNAGLQQYFAKEWNASAEQVDIKGIYSLVGRQASRVRVFMWQEKKVADLSKAVAEKPKEAGSPESPPKEAAAPAAAAPAPAAPPALAKK